MIDWQPLWLSLRLALITTTILLLLAIPLGYWLAYSRHRWKIALSIYDLDGDTLRWCAGEPGRKDRLEDFPPEDHLAYYCTQFRRERR